MKLQIDTVEKTVFVSDSVEIYELVKQLMRMFPKGEWRQYTIIPTDPSIWQEPYPIIVTWPYPSWTPSTNPYSDPYKVTCSADPIDKNYNTTK